MRITEHRAALKAALEKIAPAHITAPNTINNDCLIINEGTPFVTSEQVTYEDYVQSIYFEVLAVITPRGEKANELAALDDLVEKTSDALHQLAPISDFSVSQYHRVDVAGQAYPVATINFKTEL